MTTEAPPPPIPELRDALALARELLLEPTPQNIARCHGPLTAAATGMERLAAVVREHGKDGRAACPARELHEEVIGISTLLDQAASFHAGLLARMVAAASAQDAGSSFARPCARLQIDA